MPLRHRVSKDVMDRYAADEALAATYRDRLAAATAAEDALRTVSGEHRDPARDRELAADLDAALGAVLLAAEAAERVACGIGTYAPDDQPGKARRTAEIKRRKAKAKPAVRPWTDEVDRLRTAREAHRLSFRPLTGTPV